VPVKLTRYQLTILRAIAEGKVSKPNRRYSNWWIADPSRPSGFRPMYSAMNVIEGEGLAEPGVPGPRYTPAVLTDAGRAALDHADGRRRG